MQKTGHVQPRARAVPGQGHFIHKTCGGRCGIVRDKGSRVLFTDPQ
jgi:hypothetical protein